MAYALFKLLFSIQPVLQHLLNAYCIQRHGLQHDSCIQEAKILFVTDKYARKQNVKMVNKWSELWQHRRVTDAQGNKEYLLKEMHLNWASKVRAEVSQWHRGRQRSILWRRMLEGRKWLLFKACLCFLRLGVGLGKS